MPTSTIGDDRNRHGWRPIIVMAMMITMAMVIMDVDDDVVGMPTMIVTGMMMGITMIVAVAVVVVDDQRRHFQPDVAYSLSEAYPAGGR